MLLRRSIGIDATSECVWRVLTDPREVVQWESGVFEAIDAPHDYPKPGQTVHWRYRSGPFRILIDRPQVVQRARVLRSLLSLGPFRFDETYTIEPAGTGCVLAVEVDTSASLPVIGGLVDRLYLGPSTRRDIIAALESLKRHCESAKA